MDRLKLVVFDLDYTLWPFWIDTHVTPPFKKLNGEIYDKNNVKVKCYPEVPEILQDLTTTGYEIAVASRTSIREAHDLITLFGWEKYIKYKEIYPGRKITHFHRLKEKSKREFDEMIFFDDEARNVRDVGSLGVMSILVGSTGITKQGVAAAFEKYRKDQLWRY